MSAADRSDLQVLGITIDRDADIPIGVQLAWALRARVQDGRLTPGQRIPGLRDLAEGLGVNVNTVRTVFQRLEAEGILDSQQGSGTFVASTPPQHSAVGAIAADAARAAYDTGVDPREVAAALYVAPSLAVEASDSQSARRRRLRIQISSLEQTLSELETNHPGIVPQSDLHTATGPSAPRLLDVEELEQVQAQLVRRLAAVQGAIDALDELAVDPESTVETPRAAVTAPKRKSRARTAPRPASAGT